MLLFPLIQALPVEPRALATELRLWQTSLQPQALLSTFAAPGAVDRSAANKVWLCKRPVYPMSLLRQSGIPEDVAQQVHERGYHAYVLHGPTPELSRAFQFTSTNGFEQYQKVLSIVQEKSAEGWEKIRGTDLDAWGRAVAANITGPGQVGALMGSVVYAQPDADCWEGTAPPRCARPELENATVAYAKSRPEFNLLHNNCARFACAMLASCGPAPVAATDQCSPDACAESLMFGGPTGEPGCGMRRAKRATPGAVSPQPDASALQAQLASLQKRADAAAIGGGASLTESIDTVKGLLKDGASLAAQWNSWAQNQGYDAPPELKAAQMLTDRVQERVEQMRPFAQAADARAAEHDPLPQLAANDAHVKTAQEMLRTFLAGK